MSKQILARIVAAIRAKTGLVQWKGTREVLDWFNRLQDKSRLTYINLDIETYYPSISPGLLSRALRWAAAFDHIEELEIEIIMHARRSVLLYKGRAWVKMTNPEFDVGMGSYDGAEISDLGGLYNVQCTCCT